MKWRWMAGMKATNGARVINVCDDGYVEGFLGAQMVEVDSEAVPEGDDPATMGCLLTQFRETHPGATVEILPHDNGIKKSRLKIAGGKLQKDAFLVWLEGWQ